MIRPNKANAKGLLFPLPLGMGKTREPSSRVGDATNMPDPPIVAEPGTAPGRPTDGLPRHRLRFGLRTLLLAPVVVVTLLLCAFPKLLTGDYADVTVTDIHVGEGAVLIKMEASYSAGTGLGASLSGGGAFGSLGFSGDGANVIPTWPKHGHVEVNLQLRDRPMRQPRCDPRDLLAVTVGETYHLTSDEPLTIAAARTDEDPHDQCVMQITSGSRLGL